MPGWVELIATATGVTCVWLTRKEDVACWPIGIVSSLLIGWTFFSYDLPGQALLNLLYFTPVQFYGWYLWKRTYIEDYDEWGVEVVPYEQVSRLNFENNSLLVMSGCVVSLGLGALLYHFYQGDLWQRGWDMSIVVASVIGQWLLNKKRVEAWWWWLIPVNVSSVILFWHQGAYLYSLMYVVFGVHAVLAIIGWNKKAV